MKEPDADVVPLCASCDFHIRPTIHVAIASIFPRASPVYEVGLGFIYRRQHSFVSLEWRAHLTFRLPPVWTTLTNRRTYLRRLRARPLGTLGFSWGSTCVGGQSSSVGHRRSGRGYRAANLGGLRLDLACEMLATVA